jgi:two-component system chemotaxis response regulator CheB
LGERRAPSRRSNYRPSSKVLAIGSSTGGVEALIEVLQHFPENCPATVITQHMPPTFTASFAARLDRLCAPQVREATDGAVLAPGHVYLAPGGDAHLEVRGAGQLRCRLLDSGPVSGHRPSVDVLFSSVAETCRSRAVGVILTGMGRDGAQGLKTMRGAGATTLGQDEASCIVYGMPKAALEMGGVERQLPLSQIGPAALDLCALELRGAA